MSLPSPLKLCLAAAALLCGAAQATPTRYLGVDSPLTPPGFVSGGNAETKRTTFSAGVATGPATESLESRTVGPTSGLAISGGTIAGTGNSNVENRTSFDDGGTTVYTGRYNTTSGGTKWWETDSGFTISLDTAKSAFGFYLTDYGDFDGSLSFDLYLGNALVVGGLQLGDDTGSPAGTLIGPNGSLVFFGYINDDLTKMFDKIEFKITQTAGDPQDYDRLGFDDFVFGNLATGTGGTTPEPGSLALAGIALAAAGFAARRRRA